MMRLHTVKIGQIRSLKCACVSNDEIAETLSVSVEDVEWALTPRKLRNPKPKKERRPKESYSRSHIPPEWRAAVRRRCGNRCVFCGNSDRRNLEFDHIIPISRCGPHSEENLQLACDKCNTSKGNRTGPTWMLTWEQRQAIAAQRRQVGRLTSEALDAAELGRGSR